MFLKLPTTQGTLTISLNAILSYEEVADFCVLTLTNNQQHTVLLTEAQMDETLVKDCYFLVPPHKKEE